MTQKTRGFYAHSAKLCPKYLFFSKEKKKVRTKKQKKLTVRAPSFINPYISK
jgi:hypothetical protein